MAKVKLVNLVANGSFENNTDGWTAISSTLSVDSTRSIFGDSSIKIVATGTTYARARMELLDLLNLTHTYYLSVYAMCTGLTTDNQWHCEITRVKDSTNMYDSSWFSYKNSINTWEFGSKILDSDYLSNSSRIFLDIMTRNNCTANVDTILADGVVLIDLTDSFGAGNEPSKDWCDKHISWFEGSIFIEDNGYIMYNYIPDPLFLYHNNALDLYNMHQCCNNYTMTNLITNGTFENDDAYWGLQSSLTSYAGINQSSGIDGSKCFTALDHTYDAIPYTLLSQDITGSCNSGDLFYFCCMAKGHVDPFAQGITDYGQYYFHFGSIVDGTVYWDNVFYWSVNSNEYVKFSSMISCQRNSDSCRLSMVTLNNKNSGGQWLFIDNVFIINLTATFGAGNEPSKEWCDKYINYFEGSTTNLPDAGMFVESIDGGTPPHSSCLRTWGSKYQNEVYFGTTKGLPYNAGHKYYAAMDIYGYENGQEYNLYWPEVAPYPCVNSDNNGVLERNRPNVVAGTWQKASMILYNTSIASGKYRFRFDNDNVEVEGRTMRFTNLMLIDLTAAFGIGNEPDLAWCDKYIVLDSDGTPYIRTKDYGSEYVSNNTNHINFIMKQKTKVVRMKIQSLDHNDNIIGEIKGYCTGGSLDISNSDMVRRSIDLQFVANSKLEINKNSPFWINKRLKIFTGIDDYKGNKYWFDHGIFIPTEPETSISLSGRTISLSALDKMVLADNPVLTTTKIAVNTPIATAIKGLAELYGETKLLVSNYDYNLPYDYEMSAGDNIQEAMRELTNLYMNYDIYYDTNGYLVYEKQKNRINDQPVWEFVNEKDFTISRQISADYTKVYNDFMVYGYYDDTKATQPSYHLTITDSSHPFSVSNMKRKHSLVVTEDNYLTTEQCKVRAEYEKKQAENLINNFSITTAPIYSLNDVNRVIKVTDNGNLYTCLVDSISYPLDVRSSMQISCHEIFI